MSRSHFRRPNYYKQAQERLASLTPAQKLEFSKKSMLETYKGRLTKKEIASLKGAPDKKEFNKVMELIWDRLLKESLKKI
jgi:hypothetical protein